METEIKIEVADLGPVRERLRELGARCEGTAEERNLYFDRDGELSRRQDLLRLRQDRRARLTWKGPTRFENGVRAREEIEVEVSSFDDTAAILRNLGYAVTEELDKQRETWRLDGVEVALDRLAFGAFVELEGDRAAVAAVARRLGLDPLQGLADSYRALRRERLKNSGDRRG